MSKGPPLDITVLMPVRDAGPVLAEAVSSILLQTFPRFELLLVDDHAEGRALHLAAAAREDRRVRIVPNEGNGLVDALNTGLRTAHGAFIARMDADDVAHPRRLELQRAFFERRGDLTVVGSLVECMPRSEVQEGYRIYERWLNALVEPHTIARSIYVESPLAHPSVYYPRERILAEGGYRSGPFPEDYDLWLRLHRRGHRFGKVREVLLAWRDRPERHSRTDARYRAEAFLRTKAHHLARGPLRERPAIVWGAGRIGRMLARALLAEGARIEAFVDIDPRKIDRRLRAGTVLAPAALPPPGRAVVLGAVGVRHARALITRRVIASGYATGRDFFAVA